jgi:hypothetical protein
MLNLYLLAIKAPAVTYRLTGHASDKTGTSEFLSKLDEYHGCATGIFAAGFMN